jgi:hypothetical protein
MLKLVSETSKVLLYIWGLKIFFSLPTLFQQLTAPTPLRCSQVNGGGKMPAV